MAAHPKNSAIIRDLPQSLMRQLRYFGILGCVLIALSAFSLALLLSTDLALMWLPLTLLVWLYVWRQCQQRLHLNHPADSHVLYASLGHGNCVTLLRGLLIAVTAGFLLPALLLPLPTALLYVPAVAYTAAAIGDALDGVLARRQQQVSKLGAELDTTLDALGLLVAPLLGVITGKLHVSYLLVSIAYYLFVWGLRWRRLHNKAVYPLPPSQLRRQLAGWQMGLVATALWPPIPGGVTQVLGVLFMIPLLTGFWRDWLSVSGRRGTSSGKTS